MTVMLMCFSLSVFAQEAIFDVSLTPAGSFKGKTSEVIGAAIRKGAMVEARNIIVHLKNIQTGIHVRDEHTQRHLETNKFPDAVLVSAQGQNGQGTGVIKIHGIQKNIAGTYKIVGNHLLAQFPLKLSDFNITGIRYMGVGVEDQIRLQVSVPLK
jgi:hypothetical protein